MSKKSSSPSARLAQQPPPHQPSRSATGDWLLPAGIVAAALLVRLIVLFQLGGHPLLQPRGVLDDAVFVRLAERVASGDLALGPSPYYLSPFYTYFLGLVFAATGGSIAAARFVQVLLGAAAVGLTLGATWLWFGRTAALAAGALAGATGLFAFNEILILQSSIDPFLVSLALFALARALRSQSAPSFTLAGLAMAALALNRPNAIACLIAMPLIWVALRRSRSALRQAGALALGAVVLIAPVAVRNRVVGGEWVLVASHGGLNFYIGNSGGADGTWKSVEGVRPSIEGQADDVRQVASQALGRPASASEASSYFYGLALGWIRSHPGAWVRLLLRKAVLTFNATDLALNYSYTYYARDERSLLSVLIVGPWLIIPLGLFGLVVAAREDKSAAYLTWLSFVPVYALTLIAFFVSSRYRLALLVPLLAGGGHAVAWSWQRRRLLRTIAPSATALIALFVFTNWPIAADEGRMNERMERIVWLVASGDVEQARRLLADTVDRHPNPALLFYRTGLAFRDRGDTGQAIEYLARAHRADSSSADIRFTLGEALLEAGRPAEAVPHLEAARTAGIEPATTSYDLARAFQLLGQPDRARAALASIAFTAGLGVDNLVQLGMAALQLDDAALGERFLADAVRRDPRSAAARRDHGVALGMLRRTSEATTELEEASRLAPADPDTRYNLALLYAGQGRIADARRQAEEALRLAPGHQAARKLAEQLQARR